MMQRAYITIKKQSPLCYHKQTEIWLKKKKTLGHYKTIEDFIFPLSQINSDNIL